MRVAILSFLFNWPSTGGGNHHTAELAAFLARAGYEVKHFFAQFPGWGIGRITDALISPSEAIAFDDASWNVAAIQARFRQAVDAFAPDYVMITDAWNMKPYLAEAMRGYPYYLLYQAQENICPLNNLRLLATGPNQVEQCPRNQLATPEVCCRCLAERGRHSGALHRAERELAGVGTQEYYAQAAAIAERGRGRAGAQPGDRGAARAVLQPRAHRAVGHGRGAVSVAGCRRAGVLHRVPSRPSCSWRPWPARRSRAITSPTRPAGFCARPGPTSSWS